MPIELYPFQKDGVKFHLKSRYSINACEMGLGKTIQAIKTIEAADTYYNMVVCPAYLRNNWKREIKKHGDPLRFYHILSYDEFRKLPPKYPHISDTVIFDEAHYLKNMEAQRTKAAHKYVKDWLPEYLVLLSGTPIKNRVTEYYSLLKLCSYCPHDTNGERITKSFHHFASALTYKEKYLLPSGAMVTKFGGLKNKSLLLKYLKGKYFRRVASKELNLPDVIYNDVEVDVSDVEGLEDAYLTYLTGHISTAKSAMALAKVSDTAKLAREIIESGSGPVIVFTDHIDSAKEIASLTGGVSITGATPVKKRADIVDTFQAGNIDVLVCTIGSMSVGWTLTASNRIIFNDLNWCPADNAQAEKRIHRIGQDRPCFVTTVVAGGIDARIAETLREKMKVISQVT